MIRESRRFPCVPESVPSARRFLAGIVPEADEEAIGALVLMVSELATNALTHAASEFVVSVSYDNEQGRIRVEVSDRGPGRPATRDPEPSDPHGRGLQIVQALSDDWGIDLASDGRGKTVWFTFQLPPSPGGRVGTRAARTDRPRSHHQRFSPGGPVLAAGFLPSRRLALALARPAPVGRPTGSGRPREPKARQRSR
jgi:anti-sigma regulatory factor (Ser/Thr protein kinase)